MFKNRFISLAVIASTAMCCYADNGATVKGIASALDKYDCLHADVSYEVLLPSAADPVVYSIKLQSSKNDGDTLSSCDYLIDWTLPRKKGESTGFSAYFDGNHYRYRDLKLQEYHFTADPTPFTMGKGVQRQVQFSELLPPFLADKLREIATDSSYQYEVKDLGSKVRISGVQRYRGYDALEFEYEFDKKTNLPAVVDINYNPASISEQNVTIKYEWDADAKCEPLSEELLIRKYPSVFEKFRISNFRVESLVGNELPEITSQSLSGGRYIHHKGEPFKAPTLFVFIDGNNASANQTVKDVRSAVAQLPFQADVLYVFGDNNTETAEESTGELQGNESVLVSAKSAVRDCGVNAYPTILFCTKDGRVGDIQIGVNKDTSGIVIQKTMLCN